jgi:hypothetical protein
VLAFGIAAEIGDIACSPRTSLGTTHTHSAAGRG